METKNNSQNTQRAFIDVVSNMLEVMPGDIWMPMPKPQTGKLD